jgi:hypothetical protein
MEKVKYSLALPSIQLLLAFALWPYWVRSQSPLATSAPILIYYGINAPALPFKALAVPLRDRVGLWPEQILFFVGVIIVWFLVGKAFDRYRTSGISGQASRFTIARAAWNMLLITSGMVAFIASVTDVAGLQMSWRRSEAAKLFVIMILVWSVLLIVIPALILRNDIRNKRSHSNSSDSALPTA